MNHLNSESACIENYVYIEIHRPFLSEDVMQIRFFLSLKREEGGRENLVLSTILLDRREIWWSCRRGIVTKTESMVRGSWFLFFCACLGIGEGFRGMTCRSTTLLIFLEP